MSNASRRANWAHGHTRSALDPSVKLQGYPNTFSAIGEFHRQDLDRHATDPLHRPFRDHSRRREYPSETRLCPDVPVQLEPRVPDDRKASWLPFERQSVDEQEFEDVLDDLDRRFNVAARCARRRRSTLRISKQDKEDNTVYEDFAEADQKTDVLALKNASRFGDPSTNLKKDKDTLQKMENYFMSRATFEEPGSRPGSAGSRPGSRPGSSRPGSRPGSRGSSRGGSRPSSRAQERAAAARAKYSQPRDEWDLRMRKWIDGNQRRIQAIERENAEYERRLSLRNSRMSRGSLDDRRRSQSSLLDAPLGMLGDTTQHAKTEVEPRNTMAFIKT